VLAGRWGVQASGGRGEGGREGGRWRWSRGRLWRSRRSRWCVVAAVEFIVGAAGMGACGAVCECEGGHGGGEGCGGAEGVQLGRATRESGHQWSHSRPGAPLWLDARASERAVVGCWSGLPGRGVVFFQRRLGDACHSRSRHKTFWTSPEKERDVSLFFFIDSGGVCVNVRLGFRISMSVKTPASFERDTIDFGAYLYL
jgi:hypothetical protein